MSKPKAERIAERLKVLADQVALLGACECGADATVCPRCERASVEAGTRDLRELVAALVEALQGVAAADTLEEARDQAAEALEIVAEAQAERVAA